MVKNAGESCALTVCCGLQVPIGDSLKTSSLTHRYRRFMTFSLIRLFISFLLTGSFEESF